MFILNVLILNIIHINCNINEYEKIIYENNNSLVYDLITSNDHFRYLSTRNDSGWQGIISVRNPDFIYMECLEMLLSTLLIDLQPQNVLISI